MIEGALGDAIASHTRMPMQALRINVDIVMERVPLANRWVSETWRPFAVLPIGRGARGCGVAHASTSTADDVALALSAVHTLELHPTEAEGYFLNLTSPAPCVFVMWRPSEDDAKPLAVPCSPLSATTKPAG